MDSKGHFSDRPCGASLIAQMVKNLSAMWETRVQSLGQEDPLEKGMATHSSILAWRIPWTEEFGGLVHGIAKSWTQLSNSLPFTHTEVLQTQKQIRSTW